MDGETKDRRGREGREGARFECRGRDRRSRCVRLGERRCLRGDQLEVRGKMCTHSFFSTPSIRSLSPHPQAPCAYRGRSTRSTRGTRHVGSGSAAPSHAEKESGVGVGEGPHSQTRTSDPARGGAARVPRGTGGSIDSQERRKSMKGREGGRRD